jgi:predicted small secreted protein
VLWSRNSSVAPWRSGWSTASRATDQLAHQQLTFMTRSEPTGDRTHLRGASISRSLSALDVRRRIMVRKIIAIVALSGSLALAACNTVRGAGEDVQSAANAVDNKT